MTKRGISIALALAFALVLALAGSASAQGGLTVRQAKRLAVKLGHKQIRTQGVVAYHLGRARRVSSTVIVFPYDARTEGKRYCVAKMTVRRTQSGNRINITASIGKQRCITIPVDALQTEAATRTTVRAMRKRNKATKRRLSRLTRSLKRCENLSVPKSRRAAAKAVIDIATINAIEEPNDTPLADFTDLLARVDVTHQVLKRGVDAWLDYVATLRSLPIYVDPCDTLKRWKKAGWSSDSSPVDLRAWRQLDRRGTADERTIGKAAKYLARVGVFPQAVVAFTPEGLLLRLVPRTH